jgi:hypothetical protein
VDLSLPAALPTLEMATVNLVHNPRKMG